MVISSSPRLSILQGAIQTGISKSSYQVALKQLQFKLHRPTLIVDFNGDEFDRCGKFCEI